MEVNKQEQRSYIKIAVLRGRNARQCHAELWEALGVHAMPYRTVARWIQTFKQGRVSTADLPRTGRPVAMDQDIRTMVIEQCLLEDRRWTLMELQERTGVPAATIRRILHKDL